MCQLTDNNMSADIKVICSQALLPMEQRPKIEVILNLLLEVGRHYK